jgi:amino acid adenylation domain-containing protein
MAAPRTPDRALAVWTAVERWAERAPHAAAIQHGDRLVTYRDLVRGVRDAVARLAAVSGPVVAVEGPPSADLVVLALGLLAAGRAVVLVHADLPAAPRDRLLAATGAVTVDDRDGDDAPAVAPIDERKRSAGGGDPDGSAGGAGGSAPRGIHGGTPVAPDAGAIAAVWSDGDARVEVRHEDLARAIGWIAATFGTGPGDRVPLIVPLAHPLAVLDLLAPLVLGATLVLPPPRLPARDGVAWLARARITGLHLLPSWAHVWAERARDQRLPAVRYLWFTSEPLADGVVQRWRKLVPASARLWNVYAPARAPLVVTARALDCPARSGMHPIAGAGLACAAPAGGVGDVVAIHPRLGGVATGDRARVLGAAGGDLELVGAGTAGDGRPELAELEASLAEVVGLDGAVVVPGQGRLGADGVVAYVAGRSRGGDWRDRIRRMAADTGLAIGFQYLERMPRLASGVVDRGALAARAADPATALDATSATETAVAAAWLEILGAQAGPDDDFFLSGGQSLLAAQLAARLSVLFGVEVPLAMVFEATTIAGQAAWIDDLRATPAPRVARASRRHGLALSHAQERLWFFEELSPGTTVNHLQRTFQLAGEIRRDALLAAIDAVAARHESLRTVFRRDGQLPVQNVLPALPREHEDYDVSHLAGGARAAARQRIGAAFRLPFDLADGPLWRTLLIRTGPTSHLLSVTMHHIISDAWSLNVWLREVAEHYRALAGDRAPVLPALPVQPADLAEAKRQAIASGKLDPDRDHWRRMLAGIPPGVDLPTDRPRPTRPSYRGVFAPMVVGRAVVDELREVGRRRGATLFMCLAAALDVVLARLSRQTDLVVGTPTAGRELAATRDLIGLFLNNVAIRADLSGDPTLGAVIERVRDVTRSALAHATVPYERVLADLAIPREPGRHPVFDVMINVVPVAAPLALADLDVAPLVTRNDAAPIDLMVTFAEQADGSLTGNVRGSADLFDEATAARIASRLETVIEALAKDPERALSQVPLVGPDERATLLVEWNRTEAPVPDGGVHAVIAAAIAAAPDAIAVIDGAGRHAMRDVGALAGQVAGALAARGVTTGAPVAVLVRRGMALPAAVLGVLQAGAAFVLVDPRLPASRRAAVIGAADARAVVTERALAGDVPAGLAAIVVDEPLPDPPVVRGAAVGGDDLAYLMFTSGSTGAPRGVEVPHRGLANRLEWVRALFPWAPGEVACQKTALGFIDAIWEVLGPLRDAVPCAYPADAALDDPVLLARAMADAGVTRLMLVPSHLRALLAVHRGRTGWLQNLGLWMVGGEDLRPDLARAFLDARPDARLVNLFGCSEVSGESTWHELTAVSGARVPIGVSGPNARAYVVEPSGEPAPIGTWGELWLGGAGVARGYLGEPAVTAEKFIDDPFTPGGRVFRTGDRARRRGDGVLEYGGRLDEQIKVRGVRVEPAEIEVALRTSPAVRDAIVLGRPGPDGETRLCAWYVPADPAAPPRPAELRSHLRLTLPDVMIPTAFVALPALPLGSAGKVDRAALPEPGGPTADDGRLETATETMLAEIWRGLLGGGPYGREDDFFAAGGYSLLIAQLATHIRTAFFVDVPLAVLFENLTIADQARRIDEAAATGGDDLRIEPAPRTSRMPLSFAQERIWLAEVMKAGARPHVISMGLRLRGALDPDRLEAAMDAVAARHESLRTTFSAELGVPFQTVHAALPRVHSRVDLGGLDDAVRADELRRYQDAEYLEHFDLERGPPWRTKLVALGPDEHALICTMSHLVSDGWAMRRWIDDVDAFYRGTPLAPLAVHVADVAVWQRRATGFGWFDDHRRYWRELLGDAAPPVQLPADGPRRSEAAWLAARIPPALAARLRKLARRESTTMFVVLLAAIDRLIAEETREPMVTIGALVAGRDRAEVRPLVGLFLDTVPIRVETGGVAGFSDLVGRVRDAARGALAHGAIPFERIVADVAPAREPGRNPIFDVAINYLPPAEEWKLGDLRVHNLEPPRTLPAPFDLMWRLIERAGGVQVRLEYRAGRFAPERVERWLARFLAILEGAR